MAGTTRIRIIVLTLIVGTIALVIGARLYQLQVIRCDRFQARAEDQHQSVVEVPAMRGAIVDRAGRLLALSNQTYSLYAHADRVEDPEGAAELLAPVLGMGSKAILQDLRSKKPFVYLRRFLDAETVERIRQLELPLGGNRPFGFQSEPARVYPRNELAVHVVGYATIDGDGVEGVEAVFDEHLKGDASVYLVLKDARDRGPRQLVGAPKKQPWDIVLSIDSVLQYVVERELDRAMRSTRARAASAVLLDPASGEVLALANRPAADANQFGSASAAARRNRAVVDQYEPGSTFKIIPMAAALETGKIRADERVFCERGSWRTRNRTIRDVSPHGMLTPTQIITKSSNIGIAKIALNMRAEELRASIARFGFGSRTGVELPGESPGTLHETEDWSGFTQASLAFGQEVAVTTLQMTSALGVIANGGMLVPPRVVLGTRDPHGRVRAVAAAQPRQVLDSRTAGTIASMLEEVVRSGTGRRAAVTGYRVAGKSGTAQKALEGARGYSPNDYVASFGGFAPFEEPRLALLVVIDTPRSEQHQGGQVAAPVFGRIMAEALRYLRVPADDPSAPGVGRDSRNLQTSKPGRDAAPRRDRSRRASS